MLSAGTASPYLAEREGELESKSVGVCVPRSSELKNPKYDGNPEHFLAWFVAVEERKELRQLSDQAAIIFATEALEGHAMGAAGDGKRFMDLLESRWS